MEMAHGAEGIRQTVVEGDAGARACGVGYIAVGALVLVYPQEFAGVPSKTQHPFALRRFGDTVADEDPAAGNGRAAVAAGNGCPPFDRDLPRREAIDDPVFAPNPITVVSAPTGPFCLIWNVRRPGKFSSGWTSREGRSSWWN